LPAIVYRGAINGVWFRSGVMVQMNEFTAKNREYTELRPFGRLLKGTGPTDGSAGR
jgi:hypothetical protein